MYRPLPKWLIYAFFLLGLVSAIAFRSLLVLDHVAPVWVRPVWYVAVVGYTFFFLYRFLITQKRRHAVEREDLIAALRGAENLTPSQKETAIYLMESIRRSLENLNYVIIFILSLLAIAVDLILNPSV